MCGKIGEGPVRKNEKKKILSELGNGEVVRERVRRKGRKRLK